MLLAASFHVATPFYHEYLLFKTRVSKSWMHAITWLRKIFENLRKFSNNERKTGTLTVISCICHNLKNLFLVSHVFMLFLPHVSAQNFQSEQFDCAREFTLRKSVQNHPRLEIRLFVFSHLFNGIKRLRLYNIGSDSL